MPRLEKDLSRPGALTVLRRHRTIAIAITLIAVLALAGSAVCIARAAGKADESAAPVYVDKMPEGYRDWKLISVAHEEGDFNSFAAILGNDVALKAFRDGTKPYPEGTIICALHWRHAPSEENNKVFGQPQSFVPGTPTNVQFMIKDSKKYAATGGWGFGHFNGRDENKPGDKARLDTCFPCHQQAKDDLVFTHYTP